MYARKRTDFCTPSREGPILGPRQWSAEGNDIPQACRRRPTHRWSLPTASTPTTSTLRSCPLQAKAFGEDRNKPHTSLPLHRPPPQFLNCAAYSQGPEHAGGRATYPRPFHGVDLALGEIAWLRGTNGVPEYPSTHGRGGNLLSTFSSEVRVQSATN